MEKIAKAVLLLTLICILSSCNQETPEQQQIHGTWVMKKVFEGEKDVSGVHNPYGDRWVMFNDNGTFESGGQPYGKNTGKFSFDEQNRLDIKSETLGDDSSWHVEIKNDSMIWKGIGTQRQEAFRLVYLKEK